MTHTPRSPRARTAALAAAALLASGLSTLAVTGVVGTTTSPAVAADPSTVTVTDTFDGTTLDPRWQVVGSDPASLSVQGGALRVTGQRGDTYQGDNNAKNLVMLDVPAGDFTATVKLDAAVASTYQGAGLLAWQDWDNYVRTGLTFVGGLSPSGIAVETDVETAARFQAVSFADRPGSRAETLRLQRVGSTLTSSYLSGTTWVQAATTQVGFETTQVGMYAFGSTSGAPLAAAFDEVTIEHVGAPPATTATLAIDGDGKGVDVADDMFGIFYEDINYAADGGLYSELVRNRSFEFSTADNGSFTGKTAWEQVGGGSSAVVNDAGRLNDMNRNYLSLAASAAGDGVRNTGYNAGFAVKTGASYDGSLWARSGTAQTLSVGVQSTGGAAVTDTAQLTLPGTGAWTKLPFTLTGTATTDAGRLVVTAGAPSVVGLDMVSLMPDDRWVGPVNGKSVLRKDLAEKIAAMDPGFVRFPGGCVTNVGTFRSYEESGYADRRRTYQWKETLGPVESRPTNYNFWGYNQSYGIGYLEYFEFAEDLGAQPLPVLSIGANGCGGNRADEMQADSPLFQRWVQDTVDLVEFANGDASTTWGAKRIALGHPEPFGLKYLGLGNEENNDTFEKNFPAFRDAVKARFPDVQIISNSGPDSSGNRFDTLWKFNRDQKVDLVDEHYYRDPSWFYANNRRYDGYPRTGPKVFLGEYASRGNNLANALAEASYMTALQRNADVVRLASYAPLLANEDHVQWNPDAIWFDNDQSWARPPWHVQTMFGQDPGTSTVPSTLSASANPASSVTGGVLLSTWETAATYDNVKVTDNRTGATLFSDDFGGGASQWRPQAGSWAVSGGAYRQSSTTQTDARSIVDGAYTKGWTDYTLEVDATKNAGREGFLVGFGAQASNDYYWYNLGGFGNTRSLLERRTAAGNTEVAAPPVGGGTQSVETGRTYKVKIVVSGPQVVVYLDGVEQLRYDSSVLSQTMYEVVTRDADAGTVTAKVVNNSAKPVDTRILTSDVALAPTATVTTLAGSPSATNTKADPDRVAPEVTTVDGVDNDFTYTFAPYSVTFVTMRPTGALPPTTEPSTGPTTPPTTQPTTQPTQPGAGQTTPPVTGQAPAAAPTSVVVSAPRKAKAGSRPTVSLTLAPAPAGSAVATVTVVRKVVRWVGGKKKVKKKTVLVQQVPVVGGVARLRLPRLKAGTHTVTATYAGPSGTLTDTAKVRVRARR